MKKRTTVTTIGAIWLLLLLVISTPTVPPVEAYDYDYGHGSVIYTSDWNQTDDDLMRAGWAADDIYNLFAEKGDYEIVGYYWDPIYQMWIPIWEWIHVYGHVENFKGGIYRWRVEQQAEDAEENHPTTAIFYHGHAGKINITDNIEDGPWRYFVYEQAPQGGPPYPPEHPNTVDDYWHIYPNTEDNHRFVFLWACMQGNEVGGYTSGYHLGMPYAWSHRSSLSTDGYEDPDTGNYIFIGFENIWKSLSEWATQNNNYKYWLVFFYNYALNGYSIHNALDEASNLVWNKDFDETPLYQGYNATNPYYEWWGGMGEPWYWSWMRVYGNADRTLPH